jgi:thiol-disulfide isomerase/thioredoxin
MRSRGTLDFDRRAVTLGLGAVLSVGLMGASGRACSMSRNSVRLPVEGEAPSLEGATAWLNTSRLSARDLLGKVVLVGFWTYSCINWRRSLPYVRAWGRKYRGQGLVVVGAHAPEFQFETDIANVRRAVREMDIDYPVAIDNQYQLWNGFENEYWPALYLIDARGRIRYHYFGEGDYAQAEHAIQSLLKEAGAPEIASELVSVAGCGAEASPDLANLKSPENYLGYARSERFVSTGQGRVNEPCLFSVPSQLSMNHWALAGTWTVGAQSVTTREAGGRIAYTFHARDLHLVMGSGESERPIRFRVRLDGEPPGAAHGLDADEQGYGEVNEPRLYQLIRHPAPILDRQLQIEFLDPGAEAFCVTFG